MIGASYCCHVTLLILLLAPRIAFANINTPSTPSSSSLSPSSPAESPSLATSQSPSATATVSSSSQTLLPYFEPSSSDTNSSPSQSNSFSLSSDQSNHNTLEEASPTPVNSQLSGTSINNVQSDSSFQSNETPSSIVMKRTSLTNSANVQQESQSANNSPMQKRELFKLSAKNKNMLTAFEQLFLKKNGLAKRPQFSSEYAVPEYMLDLYNAQTHISRKRSKYLKLTGNGDIAANTVRSFVHTDADSNTCHPPLCSRVHFDISGIPDAESLTGAELRIYLASKADFQATGTGQSPDPSLGAVQIINSSTSVDDGASYRVEVHEIMRPESEAGDAITRLIDTQVVSSQGNSTWQSFDIRPAVLKWRREDKHNHGLEIRLVRKTPGVSRSSLSTDNHVRIRRSVHLPDRDWALQRPLLVTFTDDGTSASSSKPIRLTRLKRHRRQVSDEDNKKLHKKGKKDKKKKKKRKKKGNKNICQRHGLYVNFNDVGWDDWIVAPSGYSAFYCHGDCMAPLPHFTKASNHAMLQARVYKVNPGSVPMVCCVPSKMSSISMLYRDEKGRTVLKNYQDMSVDECSCK